VLAASRGRLPVPVGVALATFERVQGKAASSRLLAELGLPQPRIEIVASTAELMTCDLAPAFIKTGVGTAGRGI